MICHNTQTVSEITYNRICLSNAVNSTLRTLLCIITAKHQFITNVTRYNNILTTLKICFCFSVRFNNSFCAMTLRKLSHLITIRLDKFRHKDFSAVWSFNLIYILVVLNSDKHCPRIMNQNNGDELWYQTQFLDSAAKCNILLATRIIGEMVCGRQIN